MKGSICGLSVLLIGAAVAAAEEPLDGNAKENLVLFQSSFGEKGNFEVFVPSVDGGILEYWRDNDAPGLPWNGPSLLFPQLKSIQGVSAFQSTFGANGNLEMMVVNDNALLFFFRESTHPNRWFGPFQPIEAKVRGVPSMIQSVGGPTGNFELAVPLKDGGIGVFFRNNNVADTPWSGVTVVGADLGPVDSVSLIQGNFGVDTHPKNLEMIARKGDRILYFFRVSAEDFAWKGPFDLTGGAAGNPTLLQSSFGDKGNFELVFPNVGGGVTHIFRNNDDPAMPWSAPINVPVPGLSVGAVGFLQSNFLDGNGDGNLELIARAGGSLFLTFTQKGKWQPLQPISAPTDSRTPVPATLKKVYTEHLGQLTNSPTNPTRKLGMFGTDLGSSFETPLGLVFLFGDTWFASDKDPRGDLDSLAINNDATVDRFRMPKLSWPTKPGDATAFDPLTVPGLELRGMNVPNEGIHLNGRNHFFYTAGWVVGKAEFYTHSVLASMEGTDPSTVVVHHMVETSKFFNVSIVPDGDSLYIYGTGTYRKSPIYLARVKTVDLRDRNKWEYYRGSRGGSPIFGPRESTAVGLFPLDCAGEISVRKATNSGPFFMTYNCDQSFLPRGIHFRTATKLWGPWSEPEMLIDVNKPDHGRSDHGYGISIHQNVDKIGFDDGLGEANRPFEQGAFGGEYAPYLVPRWFDFPAPGVFQIVYVLSSWNPYQVHVMRSVVAENPQNVTKPKRGVGLKAARLTNGDFAEGLAGWEKTADFFPFEKDGVHFITTFSPDTGDKHTGKMFQDFTLDSTTNELSFKVHGGDAVVRLYHKGAVVRETRARRTNETNTIVRWFLDNLQGEKLTLSIEDDLTEPWGFISVGGFEFKESH